MTGVSEHNISDDKLLAATGRTRAAWHDLLDAENASAWTHTQIARWLVETHDVDGWWAQGITVAYEQAKGIRMPGQQPDGTFSASSSKSLPGSVPELHELAIDAYSTAVGQGPASVSREARHPTARWKLADGTAVLLTVSPGSGGKSRVALTRLKLPDSDSLEHAKSALADALSEIASRVDRSVD
jgi:hypothetical protein